MFNSEEFKKYVTKKFKPNSWYKADFIKQDNSLIYFSVPGKFKNPVFFDDQVEYREPECFNWTARDSCYIKGSVFLNPRNWDIRVIENKKQMARFEEGTIEAIKTQKKLQEVFGKHSKQYKSAQERIEHLYKDLKDLRSGKLPKKYQKKVFPNKKVVITENAKNFVSSIVREAQKELREKRRNAPEIIKEIDKQDKPFHHKKMECLQALKNFK